MLSKCIRFIALGALALLTACSANGDAKITASSNSFRVRVLTYNIHHGEGVDRKFDLPRIAKVILSTKPDVVALQEVDVKTKRSSGVDQAAELGKLTGMHFVFGKAMDWNDGQYGEAILSRWKFETTKNVALPHSEGREPRSAISATMRIGGKLDGKAEGPRFTFVGTHLDHLRDQTDRMAQVKKLNDVFATKDYPLCILAGDLNATPKSEPMGLIFKHWHAADDVKQQPTIPVDKPTAKIDYVLFRPANRWKVIETKVIDERIASDHRPVLAVLEYLPAPVE